MDKPAYDSIGEIYEEYARTAPFKKVERHSMATMIGPLNGEAAYDFACGSGYYSRLLKELGAGPVLGLDLSSEMVELAKRREAENPLGIHYQTADCSQLEAMEPVPLVIACWLLNNAPDEGVLRAMLVSARRQLSPGGRFVGVTFNWNYQREYYDFHKYGLVITEQDGGSPRRRIVGEFITKVPTPAVEVYQWNQSTYETLFREAGFTALEWRPFSVSDQEKTDYGEEYWAELEANCTGIGFVASCPK
ncbi:class I SAM-dependent methyltransferase [Cerasicoccus maritimus]|uniref:class I SAM-dependent methyltransferase n=1 Tax=Cerasicoccus maritimus TaxID=490089 RepID=UPI0028525187|nr:methyltransferase domain-containing protein [Cerasicoccus maritimus]